MTLKRGQAEQQEGGAGAGICLQEEEAKRAGLRDGWGQGDFLRWLCGGRDGH